MDLNIKKIELNTVTGKKVVEGDNLKLPFDNIDSMEEIIIKFEDAELLEDWWEWYAAKSGEFQDSQTEDIDFPADINENFEKENKMVIYTR